MPPFQPLCLLALLGLLVPAIGMNVNPVGPVPMGKLTVKTRPFAKIPNEKDGDAAKILCMTTRPGSDDLFVGTLERIWRVTPEGKPFLFLDVAAAIQMNTGRKLSIENQKHGGVRSIAFHTNFKTNGLMYISAMEQRPSNPNNFHYISDAKAPVEGDSVLIEFKYNKNTKLPDKNSYRLLFRVGMPRFDHPIKQIAFSGFYLYIAHGDGSEQSAIAGGGQNNDALGKILRIAPNRPKGKLEYTIPFSNPFVKDNSMKSEVWALGFRNPHHICFGKDGTLYAADAGRSNVEEVDIVLKGRNYGWPDREGTFKHAGGGLISGIRNLTKDDDGKDYEYPAAQVGHDGPFRAGFIGQAIAGGCPVENKTPMAGNYYYSDFPESGKLFYSSIKELKKAKTRGPPKKLKQAKTRQAKILFDHDCKPKTKPKKFASLGDLMRSEPGLGGQNRVDVRFGRGSCGELYWSSKKSGKVYLFTSSLPKGCRRPVKPGCT